MNVSLREKQKLADRWEHEPYIVVSQPNMDTPVYVVKREGTRYKKNRTLHRNLLLPFMSITDVVPEDDVDSTQPYVISMRRPSGDPGLTSHERLVRKRKASERYGQ